MLLGDQIRGEQDKRKIQKLIDSGKITPDELCNAPILEIDSPDGRPQPMRIRKVTCQWQDGCRQEFSSFSDYEEHLATVHMGLTKTESPQ